MILDMTPKFKNCRPRHQGKAHGGRAPAKITGLFMLKNQKRPNGNPVMEAGADG